MNTGPALQTPGWMVRGDMIIRLTHEADLAYLKMLSKKESFALGWIPHQIYERVWAGTFSGWICFLAPER